MMLFNSFVTLFVRSHGSAKLLWLCWLLITYIGPVYITYLNCLQQVWEPRWMGDNGRTLCSRDDPRHHRKPPNDTSNSVS